MSVQNEIERINNNVQAALSAVADAGVSVPENANSNDLPAAVLALANEKQDIDLGVTGATVGDIIKVAAVDADGKPTAWEATENGFSILDKSNQISTTWGDNITWQVKSFTRWGSLCLVTIQFLVNTAIETTYGFTMATLPYASISRVWLNNQTEFWIDAGGKDIRRNGSSLGTGAKNLTCFYLTSDPE